MTPLAKMTPEQRDERRAYYKKWRLTPQGKACEARALAKRRAKGTLNNRWAYVLRTFGLTQEDFSQMLGEQMGCCKGCGCSFDMGSKRGNDCCCIDHDHATGEVRGLLCRLCNITLGNAKDSPAALRRLAKYLEDAAIKPVLGAA